MVGRLLDLNNSTVTISVGSGGNILINSPLIALNSSAVISNAKDSSGGNINIQSGQFVRTPDSMIAASGSLTISTAPNADTPGSLVVLPETFLDASSQLRETCAARAGRPGSSFIAGGRGGLPPDPGAPLAASPFGQPPEQRTSRLTQAANPVLVAGIPQPVLGSPRPACRG
jgi:hypothetical protein